MQKKSKGLEKSEVWNWQSLIVPLIKVQGKTDFHETSFWKDINNIVKHFMWY